MDVKIKKKKLHEELTRSSCGSFANHGPSSERQRQRPLFFSSLSGAQEGLVMTHRPASKPPGFPEATELGTLPPFDMIDAEVRCKNRSLMESIWNRSLKIVYHVFIPWKHMHHII